MTKDTIPQALKQQQTLAQQLEPLSVRLERLAAQRVIQPIVFDPSSELARSLHSAIEDVQRSAALDSRRALLAPLENIRILGAELHKQFHLPKPVEFAKLPAPVAMRHTIGQLMPDLVLGCLHQALPGRVPAEGASCMWDIPIRSAALSRLDGNATTFAIELTHNGGTGARPGADGLSATAYPSGVWGSQVEITEHIAPVRVRRRELIPDSGGAGRQRGGLGQIIELESSESRPIALFTSVERTKYPARGRDGGADGRLGRISLRSGRRLTGKGEHTIPEGDRLVFETPGGGGYGNPLERSTADVAADVARGLVSRDAAERVHGVVLDADGRVEENATRERRRGAAACTGGGPLS